MSKCEYLCCLRIGIIDKYNWSNPIIKRKPSKLLNS